MAIQDMTPVLARVTDQFQRGELSHLEYFHRLGSMYKVAVVFQRIEHDMQHPQVNVNRANSIRTQIQITGGKSK